MAPRDVLESGLYKPPVPSTLNPSQSTRRPPTRRPPRDSASSPTEALGHVSVQGLHVVRGPGRFDQSLAGRDGRHLKPHRTQRIVVYLKSIESRWRKLPQKARLSCSIFACNFVCFCFVSFCDCFCFSGCILGLFFLALFLLL